MPGHRPSFRAKDNLEAFLPNTLPASSEAALALDNIAIILVTPTGPANVGAVCRAMKNMGFSRLRIVGSRGITQAKPARVKAVHAQDVLAACETFDTLEEALADCPLVVATSAPRIRLARQFEVQTPREAGPFIRKTARVSRVAVVFGSEDVGLTTAQMRLCHRVLTIPAFEPYPVFNLAQAVLLVCYEIFMAEPPPGPDRRWADPKDVEQMYQHLQETLIAIAFTTPRFVHRSMEPLRRLLSRAGLTVRDVRLVHGILAAMQELRGVSPPGPAVSGARGTGAR